MYDTIEHAGLTERDLAKNYPQLRAYALRLVRDATDADDVVQDAMERAWRFRARLRPGAAARPWLTAITRRAALDVLGGRHRDVDVFDERLAGEPAASAETATLQRERSASLDSAIASLAPAYREALVLHDVLGYSSREIATRASLPYQTVRTHVSRARRAVRTAFARGMAA